MGEEGSGFLASLGMTGVGWRIESGGFLEFEFGGVGEEEKEN